MNNSLDFIMVLKSVISIDKYFLEMTLRATRKVDKLGYIKYRNIYTTKEAINQQNEKHPTEWKKIFGSYLPNQRLISII